MEFEAGVKVLIIAAHPDDEVLGCGGTIAKFLHSGAKVSVLFIGEGISARFPVGQYSSKEFMAQTKIRTQGAELAMKVLGIEDFSMGTRLCGQFDTYPLLSIVKDIEYKITTYGPDIVITHNPIDVNVDHQITYEAVAISCRPTKVHNPRKIYTFEVPCSGLWKPDSAFLPNYFVDVSKFWERKMEAWKCYVGEDRPFPFPRSDEGLKIIAQYRGMMCGKELVEAFKLIREVN